MTRKRVVTALLVFMALILLAALLVPLVAPIPPIANAAPVSELADPDSQFIDIDGLTVHYKMAGPVPGLSQRGARDPALILLHGFLSSTFTWREIMQPLAADATVLAFDRPAFGLTERPLAGDWSGLNPYSPEAQTDLLLRMLDEFGIDKAILVGNSAGGSVAALAALRYPERVEALVLIDPAIYSGGGAPGWIKPLLGTPQARRLGPYLLRNFLASNDSLTTIAWHDPTKVTPEVLAGYRKYLRAPDWDKALWEFTLASQEPNLAGRLQDLQLPVLVITGDDDRVVPTAQSIRLAEELPNATLAILSQCGHVPQEECPEQTLAAIRSFLATIAERDLSE